MATDALRPSGDPHLPILSRGRRALRPYYFSDAPVQARWGSKYIPINRPFAAFLADCAAGTLPQVAFVDSRFIDELSGTSADDHPHADVRNGEASLDSVY